MSEKMFCFQCEQTSMGKGCTIHGVCGKNPEVAALQDLLIYMLRGLSHLSLEGKKVGIEDEQLDIFICEAIFTTITNVNFDPNTLVAYIIRSKKYRDTLYEKVQSVCKNIKQKGPIKLILEKTKEGMVQQGKQVGIKSDPSIDPELNSFIWLLIYGIKGVAAYTFHAYRLGKKDTEIFEFIKRGLAATLNKSLGVDDFFDLALECGKINIKAMELLDAANTETYGKPTPTQVNLGHKKGKAILV